MKQIKIVFTVFTLLFCGVLNAQNFYVKPYARYHQSITAQTEPYFYMIVGGYSSTEGYIRYSNSNSEDFTLAGGVKYGLTAGYTFQNNLGVELSADYFTHHKVFSPANKWSLTSDWSYKATTFRPAFTYTVNSKKSSFIGKIGPVLALTDAEQSVYIGEVKLTTCTFNSQMAAGYNAGLEYNYHLSKSFALAVELGLEQYNYTPKKSTVKYEWVWAYDVQQQASVNKVLEIEYVNKITNETVIDNYGRHDSYFRKKHFKESILFNSLYFGIGIKYTIEGSK